VPYLDHKLVELCARVPSRYKLGWFREKLLLRRVIADRLPARIRRRRKSGFTVPLAAWYRTEFGRRVDEVLSPEFLRRQGLFRPEAIAALRQRPLDHPYYRRQFWSVAALNLWQAEFEVETAP
jgi:asparagine synthase (glutamine-hydrolysing)